MPYRGAFLRVSRLTALSPSHPSRVRYPFQENLPCPVPGRIPELTTSVSRVQIRFRTGLPGIPGALDQTSYPDTGAFSAYCNSAYSSPFGTTVTFGPHAALLLSFTDLAFGSRSTSGSSNRSDLGKSPRLTEHYHPVPPEELNLSPAPGRRLVRGCRVSCEGLHRPVQTSTRSGRCPYSIHTP